MPFDTSQDAYQAFRSFYSERPRSTIAWVGAGVSKACGLPLWDELAEELRKTADETAKHADAQEAGRIASLLTETDNTKDMWSRFKLLNKALGQTTYRDKVRQALDSTNASSSASILKLLTATRFRGIISLNLDRLISQAFASEGKAAGLIELTGKQIPDFLWALNRSERFICQMHGNIEQHRSWVFTKEELRAIMQLPGYLEFVNSCLITHTILFVGITADDVAAGGHLANLAERDLVTGTHYWLTNRNDPSTRAWAESSGIRIINYQEHADVLEFLADINSFTPSEPEASPVAPDISPRGTSVEQCGSFPSSADLLTAENDEEIRLVLNMRAKEILSPGTEEAYGEYNNFCKEYGRPINRACFIEEGETVLGYRLISSLGRDGAFGGVYTAQDPDGNTVAVKALHPHVRRNTEMLQAFRRGVRSLQILNQRKVDGVVGYVGATEIPPLLVMDYVNGPTLRELVESRQLTDWHQLLVIATALTRIVHAGHALTERVLHRDLRPENVIIEHGYESFEQWSVKVLDFDLSWHKNSYEVSVTQPGFSNGYLAPEQIQRATGHSTRSTLVDAFGIGMLLYFIRHRQDPTPLQHRHVDWDRHLKDLAISHEDPNWKSLSHRFFRIIRRATFDRQSLRLDCSDIESRLAELQIALRDHRLIERCSPFAEELVSRISPHSYTWDSDSNKASVELPRGPRVIAVADESEKEVTLTCGWRQDFEFDYSSVRTWMPKAVARCKARLDSGPWTITTMTESNYDCNFGAKIAYAVLSSRFDEASTSLLAAVKALQFDR